MRLSRRSISSLTVLTLFAVGAFLFVNTARMPVIESEQFRHGADVSPLRKLEAEIRSDESVIDPIASHDSAVVTSGDSGSYTSNLAQNEEPGNEADDSEKGQIRIAADGEAIRLEVIDAALNEILEPLEKQYGFEVVDLGGRERSITSGEKNIAGLDTRITLNYFGSLEDTLRYLMRQFEQNCAIIYRQDSVADIEEEAKIAKLYLLGKQDLAAGDLNASESQGLDSVDNDYVTSTSGEGDGSTIHEQKTKPHVTTQLPIVRVSDMLRNRALHEGSIVSSASRTIPQQTISSTEATGFSGNQNDTVSSFSTGSEIGANTGEGELQKKLAIITQQARQQVEALVQGLKKAETSLKQIEQQ